MSSSNIPPVQQAYFAKRGEPVPYPVNTASGGSRVDGGYTDAVHTGLQQQPLPAYTTYQVPEKTGTRGTGYFKVMSALQTIFQFGILVCMIAMVAKLYQSPRRPLSISIEPLTGGVSQRSILNVRAKKSGSHQHLRDASEATVLMQSTDDAKMEKGGVKAECKGLEEVDEATPADSREYFTTFYNQFANIIMISTFTGGVQASVLSFMNDLLSGESLRVQLFHQDDAHPGRHIYSAYSLGLMLGLLAVALNLTVAAVAAVNAALACHFSLHVPNPKPPMEARIVFCMLIQFMASGLAGISLVLLCAEFDIAFTIVTAVLFFSGIVISAYHLISLFGSGWFMELKHQPLHAISLVLATVAFCFDVVSPSQSSWFTITTFGTTVTYHMMAVLHTKSEHGARPRRLYAFTALVISCMWAGCVAVTLVLRYQRYQGRSDLQERVSRYWVAVAKYLRANPLSR